MRAVTDAVTSNGRHQSALPNTPCKPLALGNIFSKVSYIFLQNYKKAL